MGLTSYFKMSIAVGKVTLGSMSMYARSHWTGVTMYNGY